MKSYKPGAPDTPFEVDARLQRPAWEHVPVGEVWTWRFNKDTDLSEVLVRVSESVLGKFFFEDAESLPSLMGMQLITAEPGAVITTAGLREVNLATLVARCREALSIYGSLVEGLDQDDLDYLLSRWQSPWQRDELAYAALAVAYVEALRTGSRKPSEDLASRLGLSAGTVNQRVREARLMGLLTPAPAGKAGGSLTSKAEAVLAAWITSGAYDERG